MSKTTVMVVLALMACVAALMVWRSTRAVPGGADVEAVELSEVETGEDPGSLRPGFGDMLRVFDSGGEALEVEEAIEYLAGLSRCGPGVNETERGTLLEAMGRGAPEGMKDGTWSHLFNNACNVLAGEDERLVELLERTVEEDERLLLRLYALQHLGINYGHAGAEVQARLRGLVQRLLADADEEAAGTALVLWREWEGAEPGAVSSLERSRAMVMDKSRPLDVRVSALHAIGEDPSVLDLSRVIAPDSSQPVILRKCAVNLIGRHGAARDVSLLRECVQESPRLAQAGKPALRALEFRLAGRREPVRAAY